jgi:flavodoxin I
MANILVLYYSRTGNTEKMAEAVVEGAKSVNGVKVELSYHVSSEALSGYDALLIGIPTYHHDMTIEIKTLFEEAAQKNLDLKGKIGAAFGSYGWSGEAPKLVLEIMKYKFAMNVTEPPLLSKYTPDEATLQKCRELGIRVARAIPTSSDSS